MSDLYLYDPEICDGEIWRPVVGYEGLYEVSNYGRVRRKTWVLVNGTVTKSGHRRTLLTKNGKQRSIFVHRLVAEAFIPNPEGHPIINHKDERPLNNRVENLEWCTYKHNSNWGTNKERISAHSANRSAVVSIDVKTGEIAHYRSISEASKKITGSTNGGSSISEAAQGIRKTAYGRRWQYEKEVDK